MKKRAAKKTAAARAREMKEANPKLTTTEIARSLDVSRSSVHQALYDVAPGRTGGRPLKTGSVICAHCGGTGRVPVPQFDLFQLPSRARNVLSQNLVTVHDKTCTPDDVLREVLSLGRLGLSQLSGVEPADVGPIEKEVTRCGAFLTDTAGWNAGWLSARAQRLLRAEGVFDEAPHVIARVGREKFLGATNGGHATVAELDAALKECGVSLEQ